MTQCTATSKQSGNRCRSHAAVGRTVCHIHGGKTPNGIAHPSFKTGRYSKHLPSRLLATYDTARQDGELLAVRDDIALLDARLTELLARVETGESGAVWRTLRAEYRAYRDATAAKDIPEMSARISAIGSLIERGLADEAAWSDIRHTLEQRRKLVESERKRLVEMQQMVTADEAMGFVRALTAAVRTHVRDADTLRAITDDLTRLAVA